MSWRATWKNGTDLYGSREEALDAARSMQGIVLVHEEPSGSVITFRDGRELEGEEATQATLEFQDRQPGS